MGRASARVALAVLVAAVAGCTSSSGTSGPTATSTAVRSSSKGSTHASSSSTPAPAGTSAGSPSAQPGPSHLVGYDLERNQINVFDEQLKLVGHFNVPGLPSPLPIVGPRDTMVLTSTNGNVVIDLHSGKVTAFTLPSTDEYQQYAPADAKVLAFTDADGRVSVLNLATGSVTDGRTVVDDPHALFATSGLPFPDATTFADFAGSDITTLVVPYDGSAAYAIPGRVLSFNNGTALTADPTSSGKTRVSVRAGSTAKGSLSVDGDVRGGLLTGPTKATLITDDGRVLSADFARGSTTSLAALGGSGQFAVEVSADRLLVGNPDEAQPSRFVDDQGHVVATFPPVGGQAVWIGPAYGSIGSRCFLTQAGSKFISGGGGVDLRDVETGQVRAELSGSAVLARTPDGCTAVSNVSTHAEAALDGTVHTFAPFSTIAAVSPNLDFVVATGPKRSGDETGWAVLGVQTGQVTAVPAGIYTWVSGAAP
jgi:hypothetical protein